MSVALAPSASAAISSFGPIDPANNFPSYYTDANGLSLEICQDGLPNCLAGPELIQDVHAGGGDAEAFYYAADASTAHFTVHLALEAAYAADGPNQEVVFQRTQLTARDGGLVPNAEYEVTDPYGTYTCTAEPDGFITQNACRIETTPVEGEFNRALNGRIGPFLTLDPSAPAPPAGYIGDNTTPRKVIGSPTGFNALRVSGPGLTGTCTNADGSTVNNCEQTDEFILQGKIVDLGVPTATLSAGALDFGNVAATPPATKSLTYRNTGSLPVTVSSVALGGTNPTDFAVQENCSAATAGLAAGSNCQISVTFNPRAGQASSATLTITDNTGASPRTVELKGSNLGHVVASPTSLAFQNTGTSRVSAPDTVVVGNDGVGPISVTSATLTGFSAAQYRIASNGCTAPLAPDAGCEIGVTFNPTSTGLKQANLRIVDSTGTTNNVALSGTGITPTGPLAPAAPAAPTAVAGNGQATVSWTAPANNGAAITGYTLRWFTGATQAGSLALGNVTSRTVTGLTNGTAYTFQVAATNSAGTSQFSASSAAVTPRDNVVPTVTARAPAVSANSVPVANDITATFSEAVNGVSGATFQVKNPAGAVVAAPAPTRNGTTNQWILNPTSNLLADTRYTVTLTGGTSAIRDASGNALASTTWSFTTGPAPTVTGRTPAANATGVLRTANVTATFGEPVSGVSGTTVRLTNATSGAAITAVVTYNATTRVATLNPSATLAANTLFRVTLTGGATAIRDAASNPLANTTWTFRTGA